MGCPIYMEILLGFASIIIHQSFVVKTERTLYSQTTQKHVWPEMSMLARTTDELLQAGLQTKQHWQSLLIRNKCIIIIYVDDCLFFSSSDEALEEIGSSILLHQLRIIINVITLHHPGNELNEHLTPLDRILQGLDG
jgi:hypothetical protein